MFRLEARIKCYNVGGAFVLYDRGGGERDEVEACGAAEHIRNSILLAPSQPQILGCFRQRYSEGANYTDSCLAVTINE